MEGPTTRTQFHVHKKHFIGGSADPETAIRPLWSRTFHLKGKTDEGSAPKLCRCGSSTKDIQRNKVGQRRQRGGGGARWRSGASQEGGAKLTWTGSTHPTWAVFARVIRFFCSRCRATCTSFRHDNEISDCWQPRRFICRLVSLF